MVEVAAWLPPWATLAVIGQSPGPAEARMGRPFVGPAGEQLRAWLRACGLDPDDEVAYTNVTNLYRPDAPNYVPTATETARAEARLGSELALLPGLRAVVLAGAAAAHLRFAGTMTQMNGRRSEWAVGVPVWAVYHPAFYLRAASVAARLAIEAEVLPVLREAAAAAMGRPAARPTLPIPKYVDEEVVITCRELGGRGGVRWTWDMLLADTRRAMTRNGYDDEGYNEANRVGTSDERRGARY